MLNLSIIFPNDQKNQDIKFGFKMTIEGRKNAYQIIFTIPPIHIRPSKIQKKTETR